MPFFQQTFQYWNGPNIFTSCFRISIRNTCAVKINGYNKYVVVLADNNRLQQERKLEALDMKHAEQQSDQKKDEDETLPF